MSTATQRIHVARQRARDLAVVKFHATPAEIGSYIGGAFGTVAGFLARNGIAMSGPAVAKYTMRDGGFDVSAGFEVAAAIKGDGTVVPDVLPACDAAVMTYVGGYDTLGPAYTEVRDWIVGNGGVPDETMWDEYLSDPSTPPSETRTNIIWPMSRQASG
jgi:effector-binding domain-containing protein